MALLEDKSAVIDVLIAGVAKPQGSMSLKGVTPDGRPKLSYAPSVVAWRHHVSHALETHWKDPPLHSPVHVALLFRLPRPKYHYGTGRNAGTVRAGAPKFPASTPDLDKLVRAMLDAATTAGVWRDDAQVVSLTTGKRWIGDEGKPYVRMRIWLAE